MGYRLSITIFFMALVACNARPETEKKGTHQHGNFLIRCSIYDQELKALRSLPGAICAPLSDGSFVSVTIEGMMRWSVDGNPQWYVRGNFHHQLRITGDSELLALSSDWIVNKAGKKLRFDKIQKRDLATGRLLAEYSYLKNQRELSAQIPASKTVVESPIPPGDQVVYGRAWERSHVNSIYEIPAAARNHVNQGRYLVNDLGNGACYALNREMTKITWVHNFNSAPGQPRPVVHDCQILPDTSLLYFQNNFVTSTGVNSFRIVREQAGKVIFEFPKRPADYAESYCCGGVERTETGYLVFVAALKGDFLARVEDDGSVSRRQNTPLSRKIQEVKTIPFKDFLDRNMFR